MRRIASVLLVAVACTAGPTATDPSPSPSPSASVPSEEPSPEERAEPRFLWARARRHVVALARTPRETGSAQYRRAAGYVREELRRLGYQVSTQRFDVPAGTNDDFAVAAGVSSNVIGVPPGLRRSRPHVVVGAHLDTVPDSPGANDNASGVAIMLELARLVAAYPPALPVVFVALGAEERRVRGSDRSAYSLGARAFLDATTARERGAIAGFLNLDMVGAGPRVLVIGTGRLFRHAITTARREEVPYGLGATTAYSDHTTFRDAGIEVAWFWTGENDAWHTPDDDAEVVTPAALRRVGRLAWESLRTFRA